MSKTMTAAPINTSIPFGIQIARSELGGMKPFSAFGRLTTVGPVNKQSVTADGVFEMPNFGGMSLTAVSTSIEDGAGTQTGANIIEIVYLDVNKIENTITIILNGTTPVDILVTDAIFIQDAYIIESGTNKAAVGKISIYDTANPSSVYALIKENKERSESSMRVVPANKQAVITGFVASSISGTADSKSSIEFVSSELYNGIYDVLFPQGAIGSQDNGIAYTLPVPAVYKAGAIIGFRATTDKAAQIVAGFYGWLEDV